MESQSSLFSPEIKIDETAKAHISSLASWAMVIVVVTVVGYVLDILELVIGSNEPVVVQSEGFTASFLTGEKNIAGTVITIMIGLLINYFLYRFATTVAGSINGLDQEKFCSSFRNLRIYFAITTVIILLFLLILLVGLSALA